MKSPINNWTAFYEVFRRWLLTSKSSPQWELRFGLVGKIPHIIIAAIIIFELPANILADGGIDNRERELIRGIAKFYKTHTHLQIFFKDAKPYLPDRYQSYIAKSIKSANSKTPLPKLTKEGARGFHFDLGNFFITLKIISLKDGLFTLNNRSFQISKNTTPELLQEMITKRLPKTNTQWFPPSIIPRANALLLEPILIGKFVLVKIVELLVVLVAKSYYQNLDCELLEPIIKKCKLEGLIKKVSAPTVQKSESRILSTTPIVGRTSTNWQKFGPLADQILNVKNHRFANIFICESNGQNFELCKTKVIGFIKKHPDQFPEFNQPRLYRRKFIPTPNDRSTK